MASKRVIRSTEFATIGIGWNPANPNDDCHGLCNCTKIFHTCGRVNVEKVTQKSNRDELRHLTKVLSGKSHVGISDSGSIG
jgi:hypothetical protein